MPMMGGAVDDRSITKKVTCKPFEAYDHGFALTSVSLKEICHFRVEIEV